MKTGLSIKKIIIGAIVALAGIGILVNKISLVTIDGNPELSATLTNAGSVALIAIGIIVVITAFIPQKAKG